MNRPISNVLRQAFLALPLALLASPSANAQALREYWLNIPGSSVSTLTQDAAYQLDRAKGRDLLAKLQAVNWSNTDTVSTANFDDNYGQRITGYITAPLSGAYVFWVRGDNDCEFALSTDENPANAVTICSMSTPPVPGYTGNGQTNWNNYPSQKSPPVSLVLGKRYFFRVLHKESTGGDHVAVGWAKPGQLTNSPSEIVPGSVLTPYLVPVLTAQQQASRFLQQATFGPRLSDITSLANSGNDYEAWINAQFNLPRVSLRQTVLDWEAYIAANGYKPQYSPSTPCLRALYGQMVTGPDQLRQKTAYALSQIFVISLRNAKVLSRPDSMIDYYDMLLRNSFGNFRQLLKDVTLHPMMGYYLSHMRNQKADTTAGTNPDENFAREIMQLFTIGLYELNDDGSLKNGLSPTYTNEQITAFARVFTGLSNGGSVRNFGADADFFSPMAMFDAKHDMAAKSLLSRSTAFPLLPARTPSNPDTGASGMLDVEAALDNLFYHPNTPPFISRLLIQRFVKSNPSAAYVQNVAAKFRDNGQGVRGDMKKVIETILTDPEARNLIHFADPEHGRKREPWEQLIHILRSFEGYTVANAAWTPLPWALENGYSTSGATVSPMQDFGVSPLRSPSVFNFYLPNYLPPGEMSDRSVYGPEFQIHTATLATKSANAHLRTIDTSWSDEGKVFTSLASLNALANTPSTLLDRVSLLLDAGTLSPLTRNVILSKLTAASAADRPKLAVRLVLLSPDYNVLQ